VVRVVEAVQSNTQYQGGLKTAENVPGLSSECFVPRAQEKIVQTMMGPASGVRLES